jgi:hypothetical protein
MADESREMFSKIDAMQGRLAGFVPAELLLEEDEFPLLTDRVDEDYELEADVIPVWPKPVTDAMWTPSAVNEPAARDETAEAETPELAWPKDDIDRLAAMLETRLSPLLMSQLEDIEILIRRVIREELNERRD